MVDVMGPIPSNDRWILKKELIFQKFCMVTFYNFWYKDLYAARSYFTLVM